MQFIQICQKLLRLLAIISCHKNCQLMKWKIKNSNGLIVIFLTEKNYVCVDRSISSPEPVYCGVPQISILGPLLLIIFINCLSDYIEHASVIMYADNTVLYVSHGTKDKIENNLNQDMQNLLYYFRKNELVINLKKGKTEKCYLERVNV